MPQNSKLKANFTFGVGVGPFNKRLSGAKEPITTALMVSFYFSHYALVTNDGTMAASVLGQLYFAHGKLCRGSDLDRRNIGCGITHWKTIISAAPRELLRYWIGRA